MNPPARRSSSNAKKYYHTKLFCANITAFFLQPLQPSWIFIRAHQAVFPWSEYSRSVYPLGAVRTAGGPVISSAALPTDPCRWRNGNGVAAAAPV